MRVLERPSNIQGSATATAIGSTSEATAELGTRAGLIGAVSRAVFLHARSAGAGRSRVVLESEADDPFEKDGSPADVAVRVSGAHARQGEVIRARFEFFSRRARPDGTHRAALEVYRRELLDGLDGMRIRFDGFDLGYGGFDTLTFRIVDRRIVVLERTFATRAEAIAFFSKPIDLEAIAVPAEFGNRFYTITEISLEASGSSRHGSLRLDFTLEE